MQVFFDNTSDKWDASILTRKTFVDSGYINKARQNRKHDQSRNSGLMNWSWRGSHEVIGGTSREVIL